jgi:hypothetical protein
MRRSEFRYGSFRRVIPLPARIQNDKVQAEFKHGVLHLTLPKAEEDKNRVVTVKKNRCDGIVPSHRFFYQSFYSRLLKQATVFA